MHGRRGRAGEGAHATVEPGCGRAGGGAEVDLPGGRVGLARLGEQQQLGDHRGEAVDLLERGLDLLRVAGGARLLEPQLQAGERGAELVRGVGDELALAVHEALEPRAHLVERAREALLLGGALDRHAGVQIALAEAGGGVVEAAQRAGDLAGDQRAGAEAEQQHEDADRDETEDRGAGGAADGLDALGDAHGALGRPAARTGTAVARISSSSVSERRWAWKRRPRRAAAISGRSL